MCEEIFNEAFPAEPADTVFSSAEEVLDLGPDIPWEFAPEAVPGLVWEEFSSCTTCVIQG